MLTHFLWSFSTAGEQEICRHLSLRARGLIFYNCILPYKGYNCPVYIFNLLNRIVIVTQTANSTTIVVKLMRREGKIYHKYSRKLATKQSRVCLAGRLGLLSWKGKKEWCHHHHLDHIYNLIINFFGH